MWTSTLPTFGVLAVLTAGMYSVNVLHQRVIYRGIFDRRVNWRDVNACEQTLGFRLAERDRRLGLFPQDVNWVHPLWRPRCYPEKE